MDEKNVVVFGSEGMLGKDLLELFNYESENVYVRGYSKEECNITDFDDLNNIIGNTHGSITNVINCCGYTNIEKAESQEKQVFELNDNAIKNISKLCVENQIHFTHISCADVFEGLKNQPYIEQDEAIPLSVYGKSKLAGEGHVRAMGDKGLVIRSNYLYGKYGKKNFIDEILNKIELGLNVNIPDDLKLTPTYTLDLSNIIIQLSLGFKSGLFHVTNSGECSLYDFAVQACKFVDGNITRLKKISVKDLNLKAERPKYSVLSLNRLSRTLTEPIRSWKDALYQYLLETKRVIE
jgi:dTDP-4-dehydrorhamnose reductase